MQVEFVVCSRPCFEGFSSDSPNFLLQQKSTLSKTPNQLLRGTLINFELAWSYMPNFSIIYLILKQRMRRQDCMTYTVEKVLSSFNTADYAQVPTFTMVGIPP